MTLRPRSFNPPPGLPKADRDAPTRPQAGAFARVRSHPPVRARPSGVPASSDRPGTGLWPVPFSMSDKCSQRTATAVLRSTPRSAQSRPGRARPPPGGCVRAHPCGRVPPECWLRVAARNRARGPFPSAGPPATIIRKTPRLAFAWPLRSTSQPARSIPGRTPPECRPGRTAPNQAPDPFPPAGPAQADRGAPASATPPGIVTAPR